MAIVPMQKVNLLVHTSKKDQLLELIQTEGVFQVIENSIDKNLSDNLDKELHSIEYNIAKLDYAINFLAVYDERKISFKESIEGDFINVSDEEVKNIVGTFCYNDIITKIENIDAEMVKNGNLLKELKEEKEILEPWVRFNMTLNEARDTKFTKMVIGKIDKIDLELFNEEIVKSSPYVFVKEVSHKDSMVSLVVLFIKEVERDIQKVLQDFHFSETHISKRSNTPAKEVSDINNQILDIDSIQESLKIELIGLVSNIDNLKIVYDYFIWQKEKKLAEKKMMRSKKVLSIYGWVPKISIQNLKDKIDKHFSEYQINEIEPLEGEEPPVSMSNNAIITPFESVTGVYGLPLYNEIDPTPYLSAFFIVFFGMCLSDAGYGVTLMIVTVIALKMFNLPVSMKKMMRLLFFGSIFTIIFGVLYGGWFGIETKLAPDFMLGAGNDIFLGQIFEPIKNPLNILILSLIFGALQVWFGVLVQFYWYITKKEYKKAVLDSGAWLFFLATLGIYILNAVGVVSIAIASYLVYIGVAVIIITQGRSGKGIISKIGIGVLSLYNLVGYMSDILSYSRLLALGLATGIIALAVNIVALLMKDMVPYIGWVLMVLILIGGHIFNLALSALGSFIHSARLQFVEFFGKFMEGGGAPFEPIYKVCKYLKIKN